MHTFAVTTPSGSLIRTRWKRSWYSCTSAVNDVIYRILQGAISPSLLDAETWPYWDRLICYSLGCNHQNTILWRAQLTRQWRCVRKVNKLLISHPDDYPMSLTGVRKLPMTSRTLPDNCHGDSSLNASAHRPPEADELMGWVMSRHDT